MKNSLLKIDQDAKLWLSNIFCSGFATIWKIVVKFAKLKDVLNYLDEVGLM